MVFLTMLTAFLLAVQGGNPAPSGGWAASDATQAVVALKQPCPKHILDQIPVQHRANWRLAKGFLKDKQFTGCWYPWGNEYILFLWEDGTTSRVPQHLFQILREA